MNNQDQAGIHLATNRLTTVNILIMGMSRFRRDGQRKDDDPVRKAYVIGNKKYIRRFIRKY